MRLIDQTPQPEKDDIINQAFQRARQFITPDMEKQAQDVIIEYLGRVLGNKFVLIRDASIEGLDFPLPLILIGPGGLCVIYATALKGIFEVKNDILSVMRSAEKYEPVHPNIIDQTLQTARAIETLVAKSGLEIPEVQSVLFFSNPGTHVDAVRPSTRILLVDGLERFTTGLNQAPAVLEREQIQAIADCLSTPEPEPQTSEDDLRELVQAPAPEQPAKTTAPLGAKKLNAVSKKVPFTSKQWILLGIMAFVEILILIGIIAVIILTS